jgi:cytochrome bd ubiquinol oxidase subunit I
MDTSVLVSRFQFAFTLTYHYLFPQLTMGLALLLVILKTLALRQREERYNIAARFWAKIFAITFLLGVITGVPMEFQFGTNWAQFSAATGAIIAQTLAMEGAFAFFLESAFLGIFLFGEETFGPKLHWFSAVMVWLGTWASGGFIIATNAWMQHPVGYTRLPDGTFQLTNYLDVLLNPWVFPEYVHAISGSVVTASFVMAGVGAYYLLMRQREAFGRMFVTIGVIVGIVASIFQVLPSGDLEGQQVTRGQPPTLAAMEGLFHSERNAGIVILGQPDMAKQALDNAIIVPRVLSFLTYHHWTAAVTGLDAFPKNQWPDNVPLLYYTYHIMVGLGTIFVAIMGLAVLLLWRRQLFQARWLLWILMLATPFPYIANSAGWLTAELGRQPWVVYGLMATSTGVSPTVSSANVLFTLIGFAGMYLVLGLLYVILIVQEALAGPREATADVPREAEGFTAF